MIFSLLFGFYIYSADLQAKPAHKSMPSTSSSFLPSLPPSFLLLSRRRLQDDRHSSRARDSNPARSCVLCREKWESSWIAVWTSEVTAASSAAAESATAAATTSPWAASTRGRTTTREGGSSVRSSCRATGGSLVCWAGSDVWASNCQRRCKLSPSAYTVYIPDSFSGQLQIIVNQSESWPAEVQSV